MSVMDQADLDCQIDEVVARLRERLTPEEFRLVYQLRYLEELALLAACMPSRSARSLRMPRAWRPRAIRSAAGPAAARAANAAHGAAVGGAAPSPSR